MEKSDFMNGKTLAPYRFFDNMSSPHCGYRYNLLFLKQNYGFSDFIKHHDDEIQDKNLFSNYYNCSRYGAVPPEHMMLAYKVTEFLAINDPNMDIRSQDVMENWRQFHQAAFDNNRDPIILARLHTMNNEANSLQVKKNATRENSSTLKVWLQNHKDNPYPSKGEKILLAILTQMTLTQVSTWFANARRRLKKENKVGWLINDKSENHDSDSAGSDQALGDFEKLNSNQIKVRKSQIWSIIDMISEPSGASTED